MGSARYLCEVRQGGDDVPFEGLKPGGDTESSAKRFGERYEVVQASGGAVPSGTQVGGGSGEMQHGAQVGDGTVQMNSSSVNLEAVVDQFVRRTELYPLKKRGTVTYCLPVMMTNWARQSTVLRYHSAPVAIRNRNIATNSIAESVKEEMSGI